MQQKPEVLLFDLGGVIVELGGQPIRNEWIVGNQSAEESWKNWLRSDVAHAFETGAINATVFAQQLVDEMSLNLEPSAFLEHFAAWPRGPYDGALALLESLSGRFRLSVFSNSNELHWPRKLNEFGLADKFDDYFASHLMGLAKPDEKAFEFVLAKLGTDPQSILFLDDNQLNVDAAIQLGLQAELTQGFDAAVGCLQRRGLID